MLAGRSGRRIRAPRRGLNHDDPDFEGAWSTLSSSFREIHTKNASNLSFEELHRSAYKIVLKQKGAVLYGRVRDFEREWLTNEVKAHVRSLISSSILAQSQSEASGTTLLERRLAGERYLRGLNQAWQDYQLGINMLSDVLMYMNRVYCQDNREPSIFVTAMGLFRDHVLRSSVNDNNTAPTLLGVLVSVILDQIQMERAGDIIDKYLIKSCIHMLEGLYESLSGQEDQKLYLTSFEDIFLDASRSFYRDEAKRFLEDTDAGSYCRHAKRRIDEEIERCRSTLSGLTTMKIQTVVEDELVAKKIREVIEMESGVRYMVESNKLEELKLLFDLESRVDAKKTELTRAIQREVARYGAAINNGVAQNSATLKEQYCNAPVQGDDNDNENTNNKASAERGAVQATIIAIKWVEDVLELREKFEKMWKDSFSADPPVQTALTKSFTEFINSFHRSAEYLSLFIDENMKKSLKGKTEDETDIVLEKAIILLRYIQDKDLFERYYKKHLCKRLLMRKSLSNDVEKQMISKMKIELGNTFTLKLEAMFKDMAISEELTTGYRQHVAQLGDPDPRRIDLTISVLTSMTWPLEGFNSASENASDTQSSCIFPSAIERVRRGFEKFYGERHSGRVLTWQANMGTADLRATFPKVPTKDGTRERRHEINVSTYSMIILLLFNQCPSSSALTFEDIQAQTNIPTNELARNLQSLAVAPKSRILIKEPMSKDIKNDDRFYFNEGFQSKFLKVKVGVVTSSNKVEGEKERQETERKNNDSRAFTVEAAIVRIMKQRKALTHQQLITETLSLVVSQFKPDVQMIKKRIESLIEREYLERIDGANPAAYKYLA